MALPNDYSQINLLDWIEHFQCYCCDFQTDDQTVLMDHVGHNHIPDQFNCDENGCEWSFETFQDYQQHIVEYHYLMPELFTYIYLPTYFCDLCNYGVVNDELHMALHVMEMHRPVHEHIDVAPEEVNVDMEVGSDESYSENGINENNDEWRAVEHFHEEYIDEMVEPESEAETASVRDPESDLENDNEHVHNHVNNQYHVRNGN